MFYGLDAFRNVLEAKGWRIAENNTRSRHNECTWYAWLPGRIDGPDCQCNDKPPTLVVWPSLFIAPDNQRHTGCELEICGEAPGGHWLKLRVYSLKADDSFFDALPLAQRQLVSAWRAAFEA